MMNSAVLRVTFGRETLVRRGLFSLNAHRLSELASFMGIPSDFFHAIADCHSSAVPLWRLYNVIVLHRGLLPQDTKRRSGCLVCQLPVKPSRFVVFRFRDFALFFTNFQNTSGHVHKGNQPDDSRYCGQRPSRKTRFASGECRAPLSICFYFCNRLCVMPFCQSCTRTRLGRPPSAISEWKVYYRTIIVQHAQNKSAWRNPIRTQGASIPPISCFILFLSSW